MDSTNNGHRRGSRKLGIWLLAILLIAAVLPFIMSRLHEYFGGDLGSSLRIQDCVDGLHEFYVGVQAYRRLHGGENPPSIRSLTSGSKLAPGAEVETLTRDRQWKWAYVYYRQAAADDPLLTCILVSPTPEALVYLTGDGHVFVSAIRTWPRITK